MFQGKVWDLSDFASHIVTTRQERVLRYGTHPAFLFVEASHEENGARIGPIGVSNERDFCLALPNGFRGEVEERHQSFIDRSKAVLSNPSPQIATLPMPRGLMLRRGIAMRPKQKSYTRLIT